MLVTSFPAEVLGTNCYVFAADAGEPCVVVDPGVGVEARLAEVLAKRRLRPVAVVLTHGHFDHTGGAAAICERYDIPAYLHPSDRFMLDDPAKGVGIDLGEILGETFMWRAPARVEELPEGGVTRLANLDLDVVPAPGHTPGSVLLLAGDGSRRICFAGDVIFAGSIGRSDLPGGDEATMGATLRDRVMTLSDDTVVLPGHGPSTTIGRERAGNPYLRAAVAAAAPNPSWKREA